MTCFSKAIRILKNTYVNERSGSMFILLKRRCMGKKICERIDRIKISAASAPLPTRSRCPRVLRGLPRDSHWHRPSGSARRAGVVDHLVNPRAGPSGVDLWWFLGSGNG